MKRGREKLINKYRKKKVYAVPSLKRYELNITSVRHNPDCSDHDSSVLMVNDQLPGTPIHLYKGERVQILVRNKIIRNTLAQGGAGTAVTVHFHGIRQVNSTQSDGVPYLTQYAIPPGHSFLFDFEAIDQVGTFFYHAHVGLQEMSVFGAVIVYDSIASDPIYSPYPVLKDGPFRYFDERTVLLSEWWHEDRGDFESYFVGSDFTEIVEAQSILINGQGINNPDVDLVEECKGYPLIPVEPGKTYRFRVIGATLFRTLGFAIANHTLTVIEVDGDYIQPYEVDFLEVSPGQRFSVLVKTVESLADYGISLVRRWTTNIPSVTNGYAIMRYQKEAATFTPWNFDFKTKQRIGTRALSKAHNNPTFPFNDTVHWYWNNLEPFHGVHPVALHSTKSDRTIVLKTTQGKLENGETRWYINGISFTEKSDQVLLYDILNKTRPLPQKKNRRSSGFDAFLGTYPLEHMEIVDFVLQTTHVKGEPCRSHPWHTHGHSHWEIAYGAGEYNEKRDGNTRNVPFPVYKDLTLVYPTQDEAKPTRSHSNIIGCGWSKIRIIADNPGIWAMHCHNVPHMYMGMMLALEESPDLIAESIRRNVA
ncbi:L-ascorbate oxidase [Choanephora cucurbitarum]|uniref:L-ascorbate oxidase n=1 Tax=Choanephora cucurbitarum TaxID=101091 RepID=A0A1C7N7J3_9FUNG|nr:L-ascorbate oxidase [Choanephora cucurbitarum]